jgi:hypothetical protein
MIKEIKKINILSVAKIYGLSMAFVGLIIGIFVGFAMFFFGTFVGTDNNYSSYFGLSLGIIGLLSMPILFGLLGLVFGGLATFFYNILASWLGGIKIEIVDVKELEKK